jgi:uncharacterized protein (UPF0332 family)
MNDEIGEKVFQQVMDIWILPEIEKRKSLKRISQDFTLRAAQVVFSLDRNCCKIRLNGEVKAILLANLSENKNKGDPIYENEITNIETIKLTGDDPNVAHVTILRLADKWFLSYDFTYNKKRIKEHIEASEEFFESAEYCLSKSILRPFFENSFAAAELAAKAILLQLPDKDILSGKNHETRIEKFEKWSGLGNVKTEFSDTLKRLNALRSSARYMSSTDYRNEDCKKIIETVSDMIGFAKKRIIEDN